MNNPHTHSEALERIDGPEAMSTLANLNNLHSQQNSESAASQHKKVLLNITLGGQSKLSRPVSSYNKANDDVDDVPSPEDGDGPGSEEKEEKDVEDSQASIKLMMDQLPVETQRKDGGLQRAHELIMQSSLEYMVEDTQAFNKKIEQRLPVAIHAQQSVGEEST